MQLAKREWQWMDKLRGLASAAAIGLLLGFAGPFGSQTSLAPAAKYGFWMAVALIGFATAAAAERLLPSPSPDRHPALRIGAVAAASAVPMTFFVAWAIGLIRPGRMFTPLQLLALYPYVALVQLLIARLAFPQDRAAAAAPADPPIAQPQYPQEFLAKLPAAQRSDILALEAEDHYLRVHTLNGSALILMRLADATALIDPRLGLRVHRSWWVAKSAVRTVESASGRAIARLVDDRTVPISRAYLPMARTALANP